MSDFDNWEAPYVVDLTTKHGGIARLDAHSGEGINNIITLLAKNLNLIREQEWFLLSDFLPITQAGFPQHLIIKFLELMEAWVTKEQDLLPNFSWGMTFRTIKQRTPVFILDEDKSAIKVLYSPIYRRLSDLHKLVAYLMAKDAYAWDNLFVSLPEDLKTPSVREYISKDGEKAIMIKNGKYALANLQEKTTIDDIFWDIFSLEKKIDEVFAKHYPKKKTTISSVSEDFNSEVEQIIKKLEERGVINSSEIKYLSHHSSTLAGLWYEFHLGNEFNDYILFLEQEESISDEDEREFYEAHPYVFSLTSGMRLIFENFLVIKKRFEVFCQKFGFPQFQLNGFYLGHISKENYIFFLESLIGAIAQEYGIKFRYPDTDDVRSQTSTEAEMAISLQSNEILIHPSMLFEIFLIQQETKISNDQKRRLLDFIIKRVLSHEFCHLCCQGWIFLDFFTQEANKRARKKKVEESVFIEVINDLLHFYFYSENQDLLEVSKIGSLLEHHYKNPDDFYHHYNFGRSVYFLSGLDLNFDLESKAILIAIFGNQIHHALNFCSAPSILGAGKMVDFIEEKFSLLSSIMEEKFSSESIQFSPLDQSKWGELLNTMIILYSNLYHEPIQLFSNPIRIYFLDKDFDDNFPLKPFFYQTTLILLDIVIKYFCKDLESRYNLAQKIHDRVKKFGILHLSEKPFNKLGGLE